MRGTQQEIAQLETNGMAARGSLKFLRKESLLFVKMCRYKRKEEGVKIKGNPIKKMQKRRRCQHPCFKKKEKEQKKRTGAKESQQLKSEKMKKI